MKYEKIENSHVKVTCTVEPTRFEKALDKSFDKVKANVEVKGFRKGHCPRDIFEKKYGVESLYEEAINFILDEDFLTIIKEKTLDIVAQPKVNLKFEDIKRGEEFSYEFIFAVKPEVTLGQYKNVKVNKKNVLVNDNEVENEIKHLIEKDASLELKENDVLENGDTAIFDFEGYLDNKPFEGGSATNHELEIGSNSFIPGFEEQMIGMKTNEEKEINVTFPADYHHEGLKGKETTFKINLHEIKVKKYPTLDDEYVKSLNKENINTVEELKESIKSDLINKKTTSENNRILDEAMKIISDNAQVIIPDEMIDFERNEMRKNVEAQAKQYNLDLKTFLQLTGSSEEKFEMDLMKEATKKVRYSLIIEKIGEAENIVPTEEEIEAKYKDLASAYKVSIDEIKSHITNKNIKDEIIYQKAIEFIKNNIVEA